MKTLLILSGGTEALKGIRTAKRMGLKVVIVDGNPEAPGKKLADDFIHANIYNPDDVLEAVKEYSALNKINGAITIAADNSLSVALVAEFLKLPGPSRETATITTNKLLMKDILLRNHLPIPWYKKVNSNEEVKNLLERRPGQYVLKPVDSRGSRGVVRLAKPEEVDYAWKHSFEHSPGGGVIIEEWLEGPQISTESLVWQGESYLCGVADRNYDRLEELYPFVVEDGGETPSRYSSKIEGTLNDLITSVGRVIRLDAGSIKGDIVLTENGPHIIEVAARLSGGYFATDTIPLVYGFSIVEQMIRITLGEEPELPKRPLKNLAFQANRFLFLPQGRIKSIKNLPQEDPEIAVLNLYVQEGQKITKITNHTQRGGMVLCVSYVREKAIAKCKDVINNIQIEMEDVG